MRPTKTVPRTEILITGANGVLGGRLLALLPSTVAVAATRRDDWHSGKHEHLPITSDECMASLPWNRFRTVINVAGRVTGSKRQLDEANVRFPLKMATAARAGGVPQFVHVSSFSVYGAAEHIGAATPEAPANAYGESKALGDHQLLALSDDNFSVTSVRLPFLFDADRPALFSPLFKLIKLLPVFPVAGSGTRRSMISYGDAAQALIVVADRSHAGILHVAAVEPFDFPLLQRLLKEESETRLRLIKIPGPLALWIKVLAPTLYRRVFQSSELSSVLNIAEDMQGLTGLEPPLRSLIGSHFK